MKRMRDGRIVCVPMPSDKPRRIPNRQPFVFVKAALAIAVVALLAFSIFSTLNKAATQDGMALSHTPLPADTNRIDASGEEAAQQEDIAFDVTPDDIKMEILGFAKDAPKAFKVGSQGPQVLIYHTHTREAYRQETVDAYAEVGEYQTLQQSYSVVAVGDVLAVELERYGFTVLHDTTDHVPPSQNTAYSRSLQTMKKELKDHPTLRLFIDLHRDANTDTTDFVTVDGDECARIMFVVDNGQGYDVKPDYESNFKLAQAITNELESIHKGFTRPICIKSHSHNQNVTDMCLLIEVGHNANSLEQAKNAAKYAALAISRVVAIG